MTNEVPAPYPGADASPCDLLLLARAYRAAATALLDLNNQGDARLLAPMRLCAHHATELYLAACLRESGMTPAEVRSFRHDTAGMASEAQQRGLVLKRKVHARLQKVTYYREYLGSRYDPKPVKQLELNAILPTLEELDAKVSALLIAKRAPEGALQIGRGVKVTPPASPSPPA